MAQNNMAGTGLFAPAGAAVKIALTDESNNAILVKCTVANIPSSAAGYAIGCTLIATDSGALYTNTGTVASCTFSAVGTMALPLTATDTTTTTGVSQTYTANSVTSGVVEQITATGVTTGIISQVVGAAATLTTGRYYSANDGSTEVFGIGKNGHIHSTQTTAPIVASTVAQGITAAAITAGSTDTAGIITTTGTQNNTADSTITVTFNKTYTVAPKVVLLSPANASAGTVGVNGFYISSITATTFVVGFAKGAACTATPSLYYTVIA